jgi:hypothetical protein
MKRTAAVVLLFLAGVPSISAQTRPRVELKLGAVTVWLGMPKELALKQMAEAGYRLLTPPAADSQLWNGGTDKDPHEYPMEFSSGKLTWAEVEWWTEEDPLQAVLDALSQLAEKATAPCSVVHQPLTEPGLHIDRVFIVCGSRSVRLTHSKSRKSIGVTEMIGTVK